MRIHFSNVNFSSRTGPNTFAHRLAEGLTLKGHQIVPENQSFDIFLIFIEPSSTPPPGARIVQRLDGIWFKPEQFVTHNRLIKWTYERASHVIWQSQFDRKMIETLWGPRRGNVISNGIRLVPVTDNLGLKKSLGCDTLLVSSSNWHPQKRLRENVNLLNVVRKTNPKTKMVVMGKCQPGDGSLYESENVRFTGDLSHEECLKVYAEADWMVHLAWLDHCPNVVIESLSQGCPVICTDSGGTHEIVRSNGVIVPETTKYNFELTDYDAPPPLDLSNFKLPPKISVNPDYLDIDVVVSQYEAVFNSLVRRGK